jgi:hypothetical protein
MRASQSLATESNFSFIEKERKMRGQENIKNEINIQADALADLPVTGEQADATKGGASGTGKTMAAEVLASELRLDK